MTTRKKGARTGKELPAEAFAVVGDRARPATWKLRHHTAGVLQAVKEPEGQEKTVDWKAMPAAVFALTPRSRRGGGQMITAEEILQAARHLKEHYIIAGKPLPDILAALA